ncbi:vegetative cell wall protein gp1-like [Homarus americanus]|uniref:vegetative cell wall protein gp1-like n=1 Tax=Homarus americanus TaxID=6706 RepID=UPI001C487EE2|nr:vegetative cell wall protein gp1-like [Homarus americanus]
MTLVIHVNGFCALRYQKRKFIPVLKISARNASTKFLHSDPEYGFPCHSTHNTDPLGNSLNLSPPGHSQPQSPGHSQPQPGQSQPQSPGPPSHSPTGHSQPQSPVPQSLVTHSHSPGQSQPQSPGHSQLAPGHSRHSPLVTHSHSPWSLTATAPGQSTTTVPGHSHSPLVTHNHSPLVCSRHSPMVTPQPQSWSLTPQSPGQSHPQSPGPPSHCPLVLTPAVPLVPHNLVPSFLPTTSPGHSLNLRSPGPPPGPVPYSPTKVS